MKKVSLTALFLIFIFSLLFGCQSKENISIETTVNPSTESGNDIKLSIDSDFKSVIISKPKGFNEITFDDKESLKALQNIFSSAIKEPGVVDMVDPEFYLEVIYGKEG
ncbi:hypothetical protein [Bacillus benzoevorans]|uniref:YhfM-like domain-containing protein n=1 Tax=Bacillus benzoevorans TaxID=1456 RepID=A0A7X0LWQ3_9BACI|nr:hypothetical protein [Bacillus benzoevorans]MBB6445619.1 hypothetical protein [Bacillus benzoevorans]